MVTEYSRRLGKITPEQFQAALDRFNLGDYLHAEPVPFGLFGQNVFVTSTRGEFVLRGVPHDAWQFPAEQFFVEQLHQRTRVLVPYPYLLDPTTEIFGWSYVLMPRLPGLSLSDQHMVAKLPLHDRLAIAQALARTLVEVHTLTWDCSGEYDPDTRHIQPFEQNYGSWVVKGIREKLDKACNYNPHTSRTDLTWAESIITNGMYSLDIAFTPCAVLGDYGEHNTVVERISGGWHVSGVFDLMTAHFGDGNADLCVPVAGYLKTDPVLANAFIEEYLQHRPARAGFAERQQVYTLGLYASMWEYWQRAQGGPPENFNVCFEEWANPFVEYWGAHG